MKLSIVTTLYSSAPFIKRFYERITAAAAQITADFEIIFVVDGSPDDSTNVAAQLFEKDTRITIVDLSRNFGHHKAIMTGLAYAKGEFVFLIDSDLEEDPGLLNKFWEILDGDAETDVVAGVQKETRKLPMIAKLCRDAFYIAINSLVNDEIDPNEMVVRLMRRRYVDALLSHSESNLFLPGIWSSIGFRKRCFETEKKANAASSYTLAKKINMAIDAITSFSAKPLYFLFVFGSAISLIAFGILLYAIFKKLFLDIAMGWTSLIVSIWAGIGLTMMSLGIIGIYLSKIFIEVKRRPSSIVRRLYSHKKENQNG